MNYHLHLMGRIEELVRCACGGPMILLGIEMILDGLVLQMSVRQVGEVSER